METPQPPVIKFHTYDYFIITIAILVILLGISTCNGCHKQPNVVDSADTLYSKAVAYKKYTDSIVKLQKDSISILNDKISSLQNQDSQIIVHYKHIRDTILSVPDINSEQFNLTKYLCPATGDSIDLKQINLCLEDGNQAELLLFNQVKECQLKDSIIVKKNAIIEDIYKEVDVQENVLTKEKELNMDLNKKLVKQIHRKKIWRSIAGVTATVAIIFGIVIF